MALRSWVAWSTVSRSAPVLTFRADHHGRGSCSSTPSAPAGALSLGRRQGCTCSAPQALNWVPATATTPQSSLNRPIGVGRALVVAHAELIDVHAAAHAQGGTVNDVVLAAVAGALRTVLADRGEDVDQLVVSMPVSSRRMASATQLGNQVGVIPVMVPTTGEPTERLAAVARLTRHRKTATPGSSAALLSPVFRLLATVGVFGWFIDRQRLVNTFLSNLRGPEHELRLAGALVTEVVPVPTITGNITVAFAALSYAGRLHVSVIADPERCPDLPAIGEALQRELDVLTALETAIPAGSS